MPPNQRRPLPKKKRSRNRRRNVALNQNRQETINDGSASNVTHPFSGMSNRQKKETLFRMLHDLPPPVRKEFKKYPPLVQLLGKLTLNGLSKNSYDALHSMTPDAIAGMETGVFNERLETIAPFISNDDNSGGDLMLNSGPSWMHPYDIEGIEQYNAEPGPSKFDGYQQHSPVRYVTERGVGYGKQHDDESGFLGVPSGIGFSHSFMRGSANVNYLSQGGSGLFDGDHSEPEMDRFHDPLCRTNNVDRHERDRFRMVDRRQEFSARQLEQNFSDSEPLEDKCFCRIAVIDSPSSRKLSRTEAEMVELALFKCITARDRVKFLGVYREQGAIIFICRDETSARWLVKTVPFISPWAGAALKAEPWPEQRNLIELFFEVPAILSQMPWTTLCEKIQLQNSDLATSKWKLIVDEDTIRVCSIDAPSLNDLRKLNFKAFLGFFRVEFMLISKQ